MTEPPANLPPRRWWRALPHSPLALTVPLTALVVLVITLGHPVIGIPDAAWHLLQGRIVLDLGGLPDQELLAFTSREGPWILQSWLIDLVYATVERAGGLPLLHAGLAATTGGVFLVAGTALWWRAPGVATPLLLALLVVVSTLHLTLRPDLVSFAFLLGAVGIGRGWWGRPWMALPLFALWANVHGLFLTGLGAMLVVAATRLVLPRPQAAVGDRWRPALAFGLGVLGSLLTPYGPRLHGHLLALAAAARPRLTEWYPMDPSELAAIAYLGIVLLVAVGLWSSRRRLDPEDLALVAAFLVLALSTRRTVTAAAVVTAAAGAPAVAALLERRWPRVAVPPSEGVPRPLWVGGLVVTALLAVAALTAGATTPPDDLGHHVAEDVPLAAIAALPDGARVHGDDLLTPFVSLLRWPEVEIAFDARLDVYDADVFDELWAASEGVTGWEATLDRYGVTHVLVRADSPLASALERHDGWRVAHLDHSIPATAAVYERTGTDG